MLLGLDLLQRQGADEGQETAKQQKQGRRFRSCDRERSGDQTTVCTQIDRVITGVRSGDKGWVGFRPGIYLADATEAEEEAVNETAAGIVREKKERIGSSRLIATVEEIGSVRGGNETDVIHGSIRCGRSRKLPNNRQRVAGVQLFGESECVDTAVISAELRGEEHEKKCDGTNTDE